MRNICIVKATQGRTLYKEGFRMRSGDWKSHRKCSRMYSARKADRRRKALGSHSEVDIALEEVWLRTDKESERKH